MAHAAESMHWYGRDSSTQYTIIGANGKERPTTLRDARKHGYVPSVTTILKLLDKPGLNRWKLDQALMSALTLPQVEGESLDSFKERARADSEEHSKQAAQTGTDIHAALQGWYEGAQVEDAMWPYIEGVRDALLAQYGKRAWVPEQSFACNDGYGGKIDLHCQDIVIDFKTKEFAEDSKVGTFLEHHLQLAAYANGIGNPDALRANVFVSVSNPGLVRIVEHKPDNALDVFMACLNLWKLIKGFDSAFETAA